MQLISCTSLIIMALLFILELFKKNNLINEKENRTTYSKFIVIIIACVLIFVSAFRFGFIDTPGYRKMYQEIGSNVDMIFNNKYSIEIGFSALLFLMNKISSDSQLLLIITSVIINALNIKTIYKYSEDVTLSLFLYFALIYMGTMNGIRQSLAASVFILAFPWIEKRKTIRIIILIIILSTIHQTILILIPYYFLVRGKKLNIGILSLLVLAIVSLFATTQVYDFIKILLFKSEYSSYLDIQNNGMGAIRLMVEMVPCVLSLLYYKLIKSKKQNIKKNIEILTNFSFVNLANYIFAIKMVFFARISIYLSIFNIILIPILINRIFVKKDMFYIKIIAFILYGIYFYYQLKAYGFYLNSLILIFKLL